jgi:hypothetical protein
MCECTRDVEYSDLLISESQIINCAAKTLNVFRSCIDSYASLLFVQLYK